MKAIVWTAKVPGVDINSNVLKMSTTVMDFDFFRRWLVGAKKVNNDGLYEFRVNGITYHARLWSKLKKWERKYYTDTAPESCISELRYIYP